MSQNLLKELEKFINKDKKRQCMISHDDGYGASCWEVEIATGKGAIIVTESDFFSAKKVGKENVLEDWAGLERTLEFALKKAKNKVGENE